MATTVTCGRGDKATPFEFEGSVAEGFVLHFASGAVTINPEFLSKIKSGGASRDVSLPGALTIAREAP